MIIPKKPRRGVLPYVSLALTFRSGRSKKERGTGFSPEKVRTADAWMIIQINQNVYDKSR